jgi:hypothetical protein
MIFIGSAILFAIGMLLLLRSVIAIAASLVMLCYYLIKIAVCLAIAAFAGLWLFAQWFAKHVMILVRWFCGLPEPIEPEPVITITITIDDDDAPIVELPRGSFRRLRG